MTSAKKAKTRPPLLEMLQQAANMRYYPKTGRYSVARMNEPGIIYPAQAFYAIHPQLYALMERDRLENHSCLLIPGNVICYLHWFSHPEAEPVVVDGEKTWVRLIDQVRLAPASSGKFCSLRIARYVRDYDADDLPVVKRLRWGGLIDFTETELEANWPGSAQRLTTAFALSMSEEETLAYAFPTEVTINATAMPTTTLPATLS